MTSVTLTVEWFCVDQKKHTTELTFARDTIVEHEARPDVMAALIAHRIGRRCKRVSRVVSVRHADGTVDKVTA
jgi:hypothetical protein